LLTKEKKEKILIREERAFKRASDGRDKNCFKVENDNFMNYGPRDTTKPPTSAAVMRVWSAQLPGTEQRPKEKGPTIC